MKSLFTIFFTFFALFVGIRIFFSNFLSKIFQKIRLKTGGVTFWLHLKHVNFSVWRSHLSAPNQIHFWRMGFFGVISAIPLAFLLSVLTFWLTDSGCLPVHMSHMAWMMIPYSLKIFLGPVIQMTSFGFLGRRYGHYRIWILIAQCGVIACIMSLSFMHPLEQWNLTLALCFCTALCGAIQDCALEGYRVHTTESSQQSAVSGSNATGYRLGMWISTCTGILMAQYMGWFFSFFSIGLLLIVFSTLCLWRLPQPIYCSESFSVKYYFLLLQEGWQFFYTRYYFLGVLAMIASYKLGDIFLRSMWSHYLIRGGYTKQDIVMVDKGFGIIATMIGIRLGVAFIEHKGMAYAFRVWAVLQGTMACLFIGHACYSSKNFELFFSSVTLNHLAGGIGNVTLVTYFSNLCKALDQKDTLRYAMLSSLGSLERTLVSYGACLVASSVSWPIFFLIAAGMCLPAFILACTQWPFKKRPM